MSKINKWFNSMFAYNILQIKGEKILSNTIFLSEEL